MWVRLGIELHFRCPRKVRIITSENYLDLGFSQFFFEMWDSTFNDNIPMRLKRIQYVSSWNTIREKVQLELSWYTNISRSTFVKPKTKNRLIIDHNISPSFPSKPFSLLPAKKLSRYPGAPACFTMLTNISSSRIPPYIRWYITF